MTRKPSRKKAVILKPALEPDLKIIHTAKCPSLTKKSTISYQFAKDDKDKVYMRVSGSSGGGYFSNEWLLLDSIISLISDASGESPITSNALFALYTAKSVNTPGFLLAALKQEGVLIPFPGKHRHYVFNNTDRLQTIIDKSQGTK